MTAAPERPSLGKPTAVMLGAPAAGVVLFLLFGLIAQNVLSSELVWVAMGTLALGLIAGGVGFAWLVVNLWRR